jgi:hypothetical protein
MQSEMTRLCPVAHYAHHLAYLFFSRDVVVGPLHGLGLESPHTHTHTYPDPPTHTNTRTPHTDTTHRHPTQTHTHTDPHTAHIHTDLYMHLSSTLLSFLNTGLVTCADVIVEALCGLGLEPRVLKQRLARDGALFVDTIDRLEIRNFRGVWMDCRVGVWMDL